MEMMVNAPNWAMLMDILALGASVILIGWLIFNRIRYGRLVAVPRTGRADFAAEMSLQVVTQQSQSSYRKIQQTLQQEFENLQRLTTGNRHSWPDGDKQSCRGDERAQAAKAGTLPTGGHRRALGMIQEGLDQEEIAQRCGLALGEIDLIAYMQKQRS
jgi:hypothetical protein